MLLRISLIIAILAGIGTIVVTQIKTREHIQGIIEQRETNAKDRDTATTRYKTAEKNLASTSNTLNQTKATLAKTQEELNGTKQQLAAAQSSIQKLDTDLKSAVAARNTAQQELERWRQVGPTPEQMRDIIASFKKAQDAVAALEDEKKILARRTRELQNKLDDIIGVTSDPELPQGTKGNIVAVDPKWNFVVLDIGKDKGLLERGVLLVHRDSKYIGKVRISEVLDKRAIANVMAGTALTEIQEGDQVLY